jgi:hypothetical protein
MSQIRPRDSLKMTNDAHEYLVKCQYIILKVIHKQLDYTIQMFMNCDLQVLPSKFQIQMGFSRSRNYVGKRRNAL